MRVPGRHANCYAVAQPEPRRATQEFVASGHGASASSTARARPREVKFQIALSMGFVSIAAMLRRHRRLTARVFVATSLATEAAFAPAHNPHLAVGPHVGRRRSSPRYPTLVCRRVFDCFRDDAITVIYAAQEEAVRLEVGEVRTELLLLGLVSDDQKSSKVKVAMLGQGLTQTALRGAVAQLMTERGADARSGQSGKLAFSSNTKALFEVASSEGNVKNVGSEQLLLALTSAKFSDCGAMRCLALLNVSASQLRKAVETELTKPEGELASVGAAGGDAKLKLGEVATNLTEMARQGLLDPVIGRDAETQRILQILLRKTKNNACLVGPPGVGKTAVAEGLAQRIVEGRVPLKLRGREVFSLDLGLLVAGTKYRGEFEERIKSVIDEVQNSEMNITLFIDEIHQLVGAGVAGPDSSMDAANLLKPALARGELQVIGATTVDEYTKHIEKDAALERRFQKVMCEEPSATVTKEILEGLRSSYEAHHGVLISLEAISAAVRYSSRFIPERYLPDKAIDLIDEACSMTQMRVAADAVDDANDELNKSLVTVSDIAQVLSRWCGIPVDRLTEDEAGRLLRLEETLALRIIGQREAVSALARAVRRSRAGLTTARRPIASLYFAGPTGVGKTELCNVLAAEYYTDSNALIRLDMSEYSEQYSVSRLVGPPPGYVGYDDPRSGQLTEAVRRRPYSVVVLDEIEKAHSEVMNLLLQVLEDGRLTDGKGRTVNFSNCIIIMTSNVGSREILRKSGQSAAYGELKSVVMAQLQQRFRPEFLNRLDEVLVFRALGQSEMRDIARLSLFDAAARAAAAQKEASGNVSVDGMLTVEWTNKLEEKVLYSGSNVNYGARPLRRAIQRMFEDPIAEFLMSGNISCSSATVDVEEDGAIVVKHDGSVFRPRLAAEDDLVAVAAAAPGRGEARSID